MDIGNLESQLRSLIDDQSTFTLTSSVLASPTIQNFLHAFFENSAFIIRNVNITRSDQAVTLTGESSLLSFTDIGVEAVFSADGDNPELDLKLTPSPFSIDSTIITISELALNVNTTGQGTISGTAQIDTITFALSAGNADDDGNWTFNGNLQPGEVVQLSTLANALLPSGLTFPDEIPDFSLESIGFSFTPKTKAFKYYSRISSSWSLPFGVEALAVSKLDLEIERGAAPSDTEPAPLSVSIKLSGEGPFTIVDDLIFQNFSLEFDLEEQSTWILTGSIAADVFNQDCTLIASLTQSPEARTITLTATTVANPLVNIGDIAEIQCNTIEVVIKKELSAVSETTDQVKLETSSPYSWSVTADGRLKIENWITADGKIVLHDDSNSMGLAFKPTTAQFDFTMPAPIDTVATHINLQYLMIERINTEVGQSKWLFDTATDVWFSGLGGQVATIAPTQEVPAVGHFKVDGGKIELVVDRLVQRTSFVLPHTQLGSLDLDLGTAAVDATNFNLTLEKNIRFGMDFGFGIPENLNAIFGRNKDGKPSVEFFNTYDGTDESVTRFTLAVDSIAGLGFQPITSPIKAITFEKQDDLIFCNADMGEFGAGRFQVPVFSFNGDAFTASGGFEQIRPLSLPLTPIKLLLDACGLSIIGDKLPRGLPLQGINLYDASTGKLNFEAFVQMLENLGGFTIDKATHDALELIENQLDHLPDRFKSYLDIEIPDKFDFAVTFTLDGGFRGHIAVDEAHAIRFLYPTLGPLLLPQLNGITLRGISVGEVLDGSLALLTVDCDIDQFDLPTLLAALTLPLDKLPILPNSRSLQTRAIIRNLFMLIVYESPIPIPIPLFFDELGFEYLGLPGLEFQTHFAFPKPKLNAATSAKVFTDFEQFVTDRNHLLDASIPPQGMDLQLTIGPNFIQLPKYLGGKVLGSKDSTMIVSAYSNLAHLMNALKTLSLNEIVQAVPLEYRVGTEQVTFGPLSISVSWLITTPDEFREVGYQRLQLNAGDTDRMLAILPTRPQKDDQGLVIFLKGGWSIVNGFSLDTAFGLIGTARGFATGLQINGSIGNFLSVDMGGMVVISQSNDAYFSLNGHSRLILLGSAIFIGDIQMDDTHFHLTGQLVLFPPSSPLQIGGAGRVDIDQHGQFALGLDVNVSLASFVLLSAHVALDNNSLHLTGQWLGVKAAFDLVVQKSTFILSGSVKIGFSLNTTIGPIYEPITGVKVIDSLTINTQLSAGFAVILGTSGFAADVSGNFVWNSVNLSFPSFHIAISPSDVNAATQLLATQIKNNANAIFAQVYHSMSDWLRAGVNGLVTVTTSLIPAVNAAKQWSTTAWNATTKWSTQAWQAASQWTASAWNATTKWSDDAWNATTHWSNDAWNATTKWGDSAWNATTKWSTDAWNATTKWSADGWKATVTWNTDVWNATTTWTKDVWNNSLTWTASQFNNVTATVAAYLKSLIPHGDSVIPHGDFISVPHGDTSSPHIDTGKLHIDVASSHSDAITIPHGDTGTPHGDTITIPHGDSSSHWDVGSGWFHTDSRPHWDTAAAHADIGAIHVDTPSAHFDVGTPHADTPSTHGDQASVHVDTAAVRVNTPAQHIDTP